MINPLIFLALFIHCREFFCLLISFSWKHEIFFFLVVYNFFLFPFQLSFFSLYPNDDFLRREIKKNRRRKEKILFFSIYAHDIKRKIITNKNVPKKLNKLKIIIIFGGSSRSARLHGQKRKRTKMKKFSFIFSLYFARTPHSKSRKPEASLQHVFVSVHKREWVSVFVCRSLAREEL